MSLADALLTHRPRETSGGPTANRFAYHRTWALCELLRLHEQPGDYLLVMEFHDDVLVLDSSASPTSADFFQLKTLTDKMWKLKPLLAVAKPRQGKKMAVDASAQHESRTVPRSILGKLVDHGCRFGWDNVRTINLVSNAKFDLEVASPPRCDERERTCLSDLSSDTVRQICGKLKTELGVQEEPPLQSIYLVTTGISLTDHATHGAGAIAEFLERRKPGGRFAVQPLYRTLCDELVRRATYEWQPTSFQDLCKHKGIDRATLESLFDTAEGQLDPEAQLSWVKEQLAREKVPYRQILSIEQGWRRYQVERMDESNASVQSLRNGLVPAVKAAASDPGWSTLLELVRVAREAYEGTAPQHFFEIAYVEGAILFELEATKGRQVQTPHPKPETGQP